MRTLTRYTTLEFLKVFVLSLAGMTAFFLLVGVAHQAIREGLSLGPVVRILPFIVPESMRFSIPAAALLAACSIYGRMSGENEVVAVKSLGISPWTIIAPALVVGFLISVCAVWVNDLAVSWGRPNISRVVGESIEQIAYGMLRTHRTYRRDGFAVTVRNVEGKRLIRPTLTFSEDGDSTVTISAHEAQLKRSSEYNKLILQLTDATIEGPDGIEVAIEGMVEREIDLEPERGGRRELSPSDYALRDLTPQRSLQTKRINRLEGLIAARSAFGMLSGGLNKLASDDSTDQGERLGRARQRYNRLVTEPWRRWANGFSCFFFVMVGVPLAIRLRHADFITSFFATFLPILLVYYPLMTFGVDRAKAGALPQYVVWLGNVVCFLWGSWLIRRVIRY